MFLAQNFDGNHGRKGHTMDIQIHGQPYITTDSQ